jgi:hypothetical protein
MDRPPIVRGSAPTSAGYRNHAYLGKAATDLEFEHSDAHAAAQVHDGHAALQLVAPLGDRHAIHGGGRADFRESHKGVRAVQRPAAREAGKFHDGFTPAGGRIDAHHAARR